MLVSGTDARGAAPTFHCCFFPHTDTHHPSTPFHSTPHTLSHLWGTQNSAHTHTVGSMEKQRIGSYITQTHSGRQWLSGPADTNTVSLHTGGRPYGQHRRSGPPLPLTFPAVPTLPLLCTWSSRDALTTSSSLKHATVNSFDMIAHCRPSEQTTTHVD